MSAPLTPKIGAYSENLNLQRGTNLENLLE